MNEKLFQFIWQFQYFNKSHLRTTSGDVITILKPGILNKDQGPDFSDARIKLGTTIFAGAVELHIKTSDWYRHRHETDPNYKNVILHVVYQNDLPQHPLPVLELQPHISGLLLERYTRLMDEATFIPCSHSIAGVKKITWEAWKERLLVERLTRKSAQVLRLLEQSGYHWEEAFWWLLARNFGIRVNTDAFEAMARSIPVNLLAKHKTQIHQLEALLFGQAGLLSARFNEAYPKMLQREYQFLSRKYRLRPIQLPVHFLRMRPGNFPTLRLAQLAALVQSSSHLFSKILETDRLNEITQLFEVTANDYWHYHYNFDQLSGFKKKKIGTDMVNNILANSVVPVLFSYGLYHRDQAKKDKALSWLQEIKSETNPIIKSFIALGLHSSSAFDSQALVELKNEYCTHKRCLECAVGNAVLRQPSTRLSTI